MASVQQLQATPTGSDFPAYIYYLFNYLQNSSVSK